MPGRTTPHRLGTAHDGRTMTQTFYGNALAAVHETDFAGPARGAAHLVARHLLEAGHDAGAVVDLGCGGGTLAAVLVDAGYDVLGVDLSAAMVDLARANVPGARFVQGSIWDVELPPAVAVTAVGEVVNYTADPRTGLAQLEQLIGRARRALPPGGVFVFDVATPGRAGPDGTRTAVREGDTYRLHATMHETADAEVATLERRIVLFHRDGQRYRRSAEVHRLTLYRSDAVAGLLDRAGFAVTVLDGYADVDLGPGWVAFAAHVPR